MLHLGGFDAMTVVKGHWQRLADLLRKIARFFTSVQQNTQNCNNNSRDARGSDNGRERVRSVINATSASIVLTMTCVGINLAEVPSAPIERRQQVPNVHS
jgi:hypothetical protein